MKKSFIFILSNALLFGAAAQELPVSDPAQMQTDAYVQLVQGDQSLETGRLDEALDQYQAAKHLYEGLAAAFPSWEPRIIRYRAAYCDNRIAEINRRIGERVAAYSPQSAADATAVYYGDGGDYDYAASAPSPAPAPAGGVPESVYQSALRRADSLQAQLDSARNAEQQARAELARVRSDLDRANRSLSNRSLAADSELARLRELQGRQQLELRSMRAENARLKNQLDAKADLDAVLNDMEGRLNTLLDENRAFREQVQSLRTALDDCEKRAPGAEPLPGGDGAPAAAEDAPLAGEPPAPVPAFDSAGIDWAADDDGTGDNDGDYDDIPELEDDSDIPAIPAPGRDSGSVPPQDAAPAAEPPAPAPAARHGRIRATFPPRPVPPGVAPADFIRLLLNNSENEAAFATVQKAREDAPDDVNLATLEGITLIRLQHYAAAADLLHALSVEHPDDATIHANLGAAWLGEGFYAGAREALRNAIELNPSIGAEYYYNLALVCALAEPRDLDTARDCYRKAREAGLPADPQLDELLP